MRNTLAVGLACTSILALVTVLGSAAAPALSTPALSTHALNSCSCTAPDGSCSASVSCQGGCVPLCANNGDCSAQCSGAYGFFSTEVTLQMENGNYPALISELARTSGRKLAFSPSRPDTLFNIGSKRALLWDIFEMLADRGELQVAGEDFEKLKRLRHVLVSGERVSISIQNTSVSTFVNDMAGLTGLRLRVTQGNPMSTVNVTLQEATLEDILRKVSEQTGVKIIEERDGAGK